MLLNFIPSNLHIDGTPLSGVQILEPILRNAYKINIMDTFLEGMVSAIYKFGYLFCVMLWYFFNPHVNAP